MYKQLTFKQRHYLCQLNQIKKAFTWSSIILQNKFKRRENLKYKNMLRNVKYIYVIPKNQPDAIEKSGYILQKKTSI